jgi:hypothetical protein
MRINNINDKLMTFICPGLEAEKRSTLLRDVDAIFPEILKDVDTEEEGIHNSFEAFHFRSYWKFAKNVSCYNKVTKPRYPNSFLKGDHTPSLADPSTLQRDGRKPVNTSLNLPRMGQDVKVNSTTYQMLTEALKPVFDWIRDLVRMVFFFNRQLSENNPA